MFSCFQPENTTECENAQDCLSLNEAGKRSGLQEYVVHVWLFFKDKEPVVRIILHPVGFQQFCKAGEIIDYFLQRIAFLVYFPVVFAVKLVDWLFDPGSGEMKDLSAEFGDVDNVGPHRLCIRQADHHVFSRHPGHFTKGLQRLLIGQMLQHLKGAHAVIGTVLKWQRGCRSHMIRT